MKKLIPIGLLTLFVLVQSHAAEAFLVVPQRSDTADQATIYLSEPRIIALHEGTRTVLLVQARYHGPAVPLALVIPAPGLVGDEVEVAAGGLFDRLDGLSAPRLVEYWEQDPCDLGMGTPDEGLLAPPPKAPAEPRPPAAPAEEPAGPYTITVLKGEDAAQIGRWLSAEQHPVAEPAAAILADYAKQGAAFIVARIDPAKLKLEAGSALLPPLGYTVDADRFTLPVRLLGVGLGGQQEELTIHVIAPQHRYEAANAKNLAAVTNLDVTGAVKGNTSAFYEALLGKHLEQQPAAVLTEYAWPASSCAPCPRPALTVDEIATLGTTRLPSAQAGQQHEVVIQLAPELSQKPDGPPALRTALMACYGKLLADDSELSGQASIEVKLGSDGKVASSKPAQQADEALTKCLTDSAATTVFDKKDAAGTVQVTFSALSRSFFSSLVLTRLRQRYDKPAAEDLVLQPGAPIAGGLEVGPDGALPKGVSAAETNSFQARYTIRNPWPDKPTCLAPQRGSWGAPPPGVTPAKAAKIEGDLDLTKLVTGAAPDYQSFALQLPSPAPAAAPPTAAAEPAVGHSAMLAVGRPQYVQRACSCRLAGAPPEAASSSSYGWLLLLALLGLRRRRPGPTTRR